MMRQKRSHLAARRGTGQSGRMTIADHDAYIAAAPESLRSLLIQLRASLAEALPDADPVIEYGMPGFRIGKAMVAGYGAFSRQCGLYLHPGALAAHRDEIAAAGLKATKTGVTFSPGKPPPDDLAARLARASRKAYGL